jgi:hypothetical protein
VNSVSDRPSSPGSNFMVGVQRPKSRPAIVDLMRPGATPAVPSEPAGTPVPVTVEEATVATEARVEELVEALVTVTRVVKPAQLRTAALDVETEALVDGGVTTEAATEAEAPAKEHEVRL